jgi:hypothetical protein
MAVELLPNLLRILECPFRMSIQPVLPKILVPFVSTSRQMRHYCFSPPYTSSMTQQLHDHSSL